MKTQIQIKTGDFEYIMQDIEVTTPEDAVKAFKALKKAYYVGGGIPDKEFNALYDKVIRDEPITGDPGIVSQMSLAQQYSFNDVKKAVKRANYKPRE